MTKVREIVRDIREDLRSGAFRQLVAGIISGAIVTVYSLSSATLLFSGDLARFTVVAMGITLAAATILTASGALRSSFRPTLAQVQEVPVAYIAAILATLPMGTAQLPTAVAIVGLSSAAIGVAFLLVGTLHLSRFIRFVPFPVLSGFLSVVGFFVCKGAITIVLGEPATLDALARLATPAMAPKLATAIAVTGLILVVGQRVRRPLVTPAIVFAGALAFNLAVALLRIAPSDLAALQWVAAVPENARLWPPVLPADLLSVDWSFVLASLPMILALVAVSMMGILMNVSGLELYSRRDIDLDHELRVSGGANILVGAMGGAPGYHSLSNTLLSMAIGGGSRLSTLVAAATLLAVILLGPPLLSVMPLPVLAGVLLAIGLRVLKSRLVDSWALMRPSEYAIVVVIFVVSIAFDFLTAVVLGTLFAMILFIVDYARQDVVRIALSGSDFHSQAETSDARRRLLEEHGDSILILRLQGFLFFGSADRLKQEIERRLADKPHLAFLVMDFQRVVGIDSAAVQSFRRIADTARAADCELILANVTPEILQIMHRGGLGPEEQGVAVTDDFDSALAACERAILASLGSAAGAVARRSLRQQLSDLLADPDDAETLAEAFEMARFGDGERLIAQGSDSHDIYVIESGRARVCIESGEGSLTVATLGSGALVGEISFYLRRPRSASVISDGEVVAWRLDRDAMQAVEAQHPALVGRFHAAIAAMLAERLAATNRLVRFFAE